MPNGKDTSVEERNRKNELLKQRLAILTAQQRKEASRSATPQGLSTTAVSAASSNVEPLPSRPDNAKGSPDDSSGIAKAAPNATGQVPSFNGIPGLFMNSSASLASSSKPSQAVTQQPTVQSTKSTNPTPARRRPVASDFDEAIAPRSGPVYTRPLGQSPHEHDSESMIIEVSEDDGSDMEDVEGTL